MWLTGLLLLGGAGPVLAETVLEKIGRTGVLTAGTRGIAIPFAFINEKNEWIGFSIDLLEAVRIRLEKKLGKPIKLEKKEVGGDPAIRIQLVAKRTHRRGVRGHHVQPEPGPDGGLLHPLLLHRRPASCEEGKRNQEPGGRGRQASGGRRGDDERESPARSQPKADVVTFPDHPPGFLALEQGRIVAYVSDGILLAGLAARARNPKDYEVVGDFFSKDPYSCVLPENDSKWRDFVNHTLMELIDSGKYFELYDKWFGERGVVPYPMSDKVRNYMIMQSMPK